MKFNYKKISGLINVVVLNYLLVYLLIAVLSWLWQYDIHLFPKQIGFNIFSPIFFMVLGFIPIMIASGLNLVNKKLGFMALLLFINHLIYGWVTYQN